MKALIVALFAILIAQTSSAEGERAGDFDYYVLALSWAPNWCALEGDDRNAPQCDASADAGWILHGLWPQFVNGWPSYCRTSARDPSRSQTRAQADLFGTGGSAWYQWKKHGRCAGLAADDYFDLAREAYVAVTRPPLLRQLQKPVRLPASVIEDAFLADNPDMSSDQITVSCKSRQIQEVRICFTKDLDLRACSGSVARDCTLQDAGFAPIR
ncbi:MAG: ribonuclease T2 [Pseudomonadota bacterium]